MLAIADGKLSIIQYLLKNGADTEITDYRQGSHKIRLVPKIKTQRQIFVDPDQLKAKGSRLGRGARKSRSP